MRFFCITKDNERFTEVNKSFEQACTSRGIEFIKIDPETVDIQQYMPITKDDLYYRNLTTEVGPSAANFEDYLMSFPFTTFLKDNKNRRVGVSGITHEKNNIPVPKTVYRMTLNIPALQKDVDYVGGFPLIVKVTGHTGGVGVIKVDSFESLISVVQFLQSQRITYILREFIDFESYARLIVLGDKVVASKKNEKQEKDFRTNEGKSYTMKFSDEIEKAAVQATHILGREFGGVDVLIRSDGSFVLTEVNFPCMFYSTQIVTGVNIADMMVEYLQNKAKSL